MGKGRPVILALLGVILVSGQDVAVADKGGVKPQNAANPNVNLGLGAIPNLKASVGLPAAAMAPKGGPGQSAGIGNTNASVGLPAAAMAPKGGPGPSLGNGIGPQTTPPGASQSASSAGLAPPGQINQPNRGASDDKSGEAKEKSAGLTTTSTDAAPDAETRIRQLPTCR